MRYLKVLWLGTAFFLALFVASPLNAAPETAFSNPHPAVEKKLRALQQEVKANKHSFQVGYSSAVDRPIDDLCGLKEPTGWLNNAPHQKLMAPLQAAALPASFDWRTLNGTTPIKNQSSCGDCWAFGTVGPLESQIKLQCNLTVNLSEQYLTSCNLDGWGCNGGWWAHDYHMNRPGQNETVAGAVMEADSPFKATDAACGGPYTHPYRITDWSYVSNRAIPSVQEIKQAIFTYGPISAAVYVGSKFQAYSSGIFDANESGQVNHAIVLVGWNDDLGTDNGYWILRNSWGTGWGENGYMRIRYGKNQVGYAANYIQFTCTGSTPPPPPPAPTLFPDLRGSIPSLASTNSGHRVVGNIRVTNAGQANAGTFKTLLYLSNDGIAKTLYLGQTTVSGVPLGGYVNLYVNKYSASTMFSGKYLLAVIDSDSQVKESNEANNKAVRLVQ